MQIPGTPAPAGSALLEALAGFVSPATRTAAPAAIPDAVKPASLPSEERLIAGTRAGAKGENRPRGSYVDVTT